MDIDQAHSDQFRAAISSASALADSPDATEHVRILANAVKALSEMIYAVDDDLGLHVDLNHSKPSDR